MKFKMISVLTAGLFLMVLGLKSLDDPYRVELLMPSAGDTFKGAQVVMKGEVVGKVADLHAKDGQALVGLELDKRAPLRAGTTGRITWEAVLGARVVELLPGPTDAPALASGKMITTNVESVSIDELLATLNPETRKNLQTLLVRLDSTLSGKEPALNATLKEAGPTIQALGQVLSAVGEDGPAIHKIVSQLASVADTVASRDTEVSSSIDQLNTLLAQVADSQKSLGTTINRLPRTLATATKTLDDVPEPVKSTRTLLRTLQPSTAKLPGIAQNLRPVLRDAKQPVADLAPLLQDADTLLKGTPSLLKTANTTLPQLTSAVDELNPMVDFLRPYTPELASWLSNWVGIFGSQNHTGNYARALITASTTSLVSAPFDQTKLPGGQCAKAKPQPGDLGDTGKEYTECKALQDANGDGIR
ncbi:MAG: Phospholipid/cholesterol/gamma-HCH transport system substrate-binding protein [Aeromicrobium sp.]|nr:Phospholipid/cholesterol/gamma-HCH transport system substrate-binding protein [Aeromicrobium sp.]